MTGADLWSRRRAMVAAEEAADAARADAAAAKEAARALEEKSDEEICAELGLPDPDSLDLGDNIRAFMASGVPERLRRRAMRRLWRTNPVLANLDGLVDHGEDYSDAALAVHGMKTTYQVGKGLLRHLEHLAETAEQADATETRDPETETAAVDLQPCPPSAAPASVAGAVEDPDTDPQPAPRARRMTFSFSSEAT